MDSVAAIVNIASHISCTVAALHLLPAVAQRAVRDSFNHGKKQSSRLLLTRTKQMLMEDFGRPFIGSDLID